MKSIIRGYDRFLSELGSGERKRFKRLAQGQKPKAMIIACSDSRADPGWFLRSQPGELFVVRTAGNIVPNADASASGEAATIEYAVKVLGIRHIIVCGHTHCGAMAGLMNPDSLGELPLVSEWVDQSSVVREAVEAQHAGHDELLTEAVRENVLTQIANLKTHECVAQALDNGTLSIHGWVYGIESGEILKYHGGWKKFVPLR